MIRVASRTDIGLVRTNNEDYFYNDPETGLCLLADGVGGHDHGEIASRLAVESCYQYLTKEYYLEDTGNIPQTLVDAIAFANGQVLAYKREKLGDSNMGTTLVCVHLKDSRASFAWIGDSRIYLIDRSNSSIRQLSIDHTLYQEMIARGEVAQMYKKSILSRMLGNNPYARPEADGITLTDGQCLLLCSDGLSDLLSDDRIAEIVLANAAEFESATAELVEAARGQGGRDNITVTLCGTGHGG